MHSSLLLRVKQTLLELDSWLDSALFTSTERLREGWERYSTFMDRFHTSGGRRLTVELAGEALTLGTAGLVVLLALAIPAFRDTRENWLGRQELAVTFLDRYGAEVGKRGIKHDDSMKLDEYPDHFVKAVLATEDRRFYEHFGIDVFGTARAVGANARSGGVVQGGSSLTQQLAKNLFLSNERSLERKIKEAFLSLWLESHLTKDRILKLYLDRAYMGGGTFGAAAAAEYYFNKSAKDLTLAEAAMLAGLFKAPTKFAPHVNLPAARARANTVLSNMVEAGFLTEGQVLAARRNPATPVDRKREVTPDYYLDWAINEIRAMAESGKLGSDRVLTVKTPLDPSLQKHAEAALENVLRQYGDYYDVNQGAIVTMGPDGGVQAIVGGRDYGGSQFNRATDALRQPGSSFKPFVYAAALTWLPKQFSPSSIVVDSPICIGDWCPNNYGRSYAGPLPLTSALARSINTIPVKMSIALGQGIGGAKAGRARIIEMTHKMGITTDIKDTRSLPIGAVDLTVMEMTAGYAVFANGGRQAKPYAAIEIHNSNGDLIWSHERDAGRPQQVLEPKVVADMNFMLNKVIEEGTGRRAHLDGIAAAGKTGTTNAYRDAWFVGYTGNYVTGVWFGNDDNTSTEEMTGGTLPATTWHEVMTYAHRGMELRPIPYLNINKKPVLSADAAARTADAPSTRRPPTLSRKSSEVLGGIEQMFRTSGPTRLGQDSTPGQDSKPRQDTKFGHDMLTGTIGLSAASRGRAAATAMP